MQYTRLTSETSLIDYLKSLERKIDGVATKGSGDIILTDPNTGVETLLGTLPDGSVGLDQFVNDVTPPGAPSTPVVLSSLEGVTVTWDGLQADGAAQPRDYDRTTIEMQVDGGFWAIVGTVYNKTTFTVSKLQPNVVHTFRLKSYDKKNNESEPSATATASPSSILDDTQVDDALQLLKDKDIELGQVADQASQDAQQALQDLVDLNNALQVRPTTFYGATEPVADPERPFVQGDWWVDTDDSNKIYVWNGSDFIVSADPRLDSAIETLDSLTEAGGVLESMQNDIDGKITTHYGAAPAVKETGDLWLDATDPANQVLKRWSGSAWVVFDNPRVQDAYTKAGTAQDTADKKIQTFTGTSAPVDNPTNDLGTGDLWINTTAGSGRISRWTGTQWVEVVDNGVSAANKALSDLGIDTTWVNTIETQADQAITTFYGTTTPTGASTGDLWLAGNVAADGTTNYQMKRWDGDSWEVFENPRIQTAYTAAGTAQSTADAKIKTYAQASAPTGLTVLDDGDLWIDTDNGQVSRWTGTQWTLVVDNGVAAANSALANLGINQTWVDNIETQADRAIATFYGSTSPTGMQTGDLWLSGVAGTPMKRWDGDSWETFEDPNVAAAYGKAGEALTAADSKILTYAQTTAPTGLTSPSNDGDLWINTATGVNKGQISRWASNAWTLVTDNGTAAANTALTNLGINQTWVDEIEAQADRAIDTFFGATTPTGMQTGDLWLTGVAGEAMKRWDGDSWESFENPNLQAAYTTANTANSLAKTKIRTFAQTTAPTGLTVDNTGDLWINTTSGAINGQVKRWDGDSWELVVESGTNSANSALTALGINQSWVNTVTAQGDRAIATFFGTTAPTGMDTGDLWLAGTAGTPMKRWDGDSWETFEDPNVQAAYQKASEAQSAADAKILTYAQATAPTGLDALNNGDLWIDTDDGKIYRYTHPNWAQVVDNGVAAANAALTALGINQTWVDNIAAEADRAIATFYGTTSPTGMETGDLWLSGTAGVPMKRWDGDSWENFEDPNVSAAYSLAGQAKTDANAKILTYAQTSAPTGLTADNNGDLWINTTTGPLYGQIKRYTHPNWDLVSDNGVLASQNTTAFSGNPSFDDWTGATPNGYTAYTTAPTKEASILTKGSATAARWNVTASGTQAGLQFGAGIVSGHLPNLEYYTIELDFYLVSGVLSGAGIILDWNGTSMTNNRATISLATEYPTVNLGKWYRMTKVLRRPTNITGTWSSMGGYVMANWSTIGAGVKDIIIDWFNIRPSTTEEIKSFLGPTAADVAAKGKIIIQSTAPAAADQLVQNLWIDTTPIGNPASPGNIPKRWDPTGTPQWRVVSDKGIADAAAAAVAAQGTANQAVSDAGLALAAANARNRIVHLNTTPPVPADGWKNGDTWFKHETVDVTSPVIEWYRWSTADNAWKLQEFSESFLPSVNIGTGTYGSLAGVRLQSGSIEVEKLAVTDFTNLWPNPLFKPNDQGSLFYYIGAVYAGAEVPPVGGTIRELSSRDHIASAGNIPAVAGDSFVIEADVKRTVGALDLKGGLWSYKADGTVTTAGSPENFVVSESGATSLANGWERRRWIVLPADLPSDTASVRVAFQIDQTSTGGSTTWLLSNVSMRKRGGGELVIDGSLTGRSIAAKSIKAEQLLIASDNNLITEPDFTAGGAAWGLSSGFTIDPTAARNGGPALKIVNDATAQGKYNLPERIRIEPGAHYRMSVWVKSDVAIPANGVLLIFKFFNSSGAESTITGGVSVATPANTWVEVEGLVESPSDAIDISFGVFTSSGFSTGNVWVDYVSAVRMGDAKLIVDGAITADKLETDLVLATKIVAGNATGTRAEMAPDGFRVFAKDDPTDPSSPVSEVVRMGVASTNDYFAIVKADGTLAASMSQDGMVSATGLTVANDIEWKGESWSAMYDALPRGIVAWGSRSFNSPYWAITAQPFLSLTFDAVQGRSYRVSTTPIAMDGDTTSAFTSVNLHYALGTTATTANSIIATGIYPPATGYTGRRSPVTINRLLTAGATGPHSLLISYSAISPGRGKIVATPPYSVVMTVEDIGLSPAETGESPDGSGDSATSNPTPPPAKINYTKYYYPVSGGLRSYTGTGAHYNYNTNYLYTGLSPAGYGDMKSMAWFNSAQWTADIGTGTVTSVRAYVYYDHWYYNSGGTGQIGVFNQSSGTMPFTLASTSPVVTSTGWPKPGGRWVTLPSSTFANIKSGLTKGITLGRTSGGGYTEYGFAHDVRLEIKYTK